MSTARPDDPGSPHADPTEPGGPGSGTDVLERAEERERIDPGDEDRFAHYVRKEKITAATVTGSPVVALCGKVWTPGRDPNKYPVCPKCKEIYASMTGGDKPGGGGGRRWPFGRGNG